MQSHCLLTLHCEPAASINRPLPVHCQLSLCPAAATLVCTQPATLVCTQPATSVCTQPATSVYTQPATSIKSSAPAHSIHRPLARCLFGNTYYVKKTTPKTLYIRTWITRSSTPHNTHTEIHISDISDSDTGTPASPPARSPGPTDNHDYFYTLTSLII